MSKQLYIFLYVNSVRFIWSPTSQQLIPSSVQCGLIQPVAAGCIFGSQQRHEVPVKVQVSFECVDSLDKPNFSWLSITIVARSTTWLNVPTRRLVRVIVRESDGDWWACDFEMRSTVYGLPVPARLRSTGSFLPVYYAYIFAIEYLYFSNRIHNFCNRNRLLYLY